MKTMDKIIVVGTVLAVITFRVVQRTAIANAVKNA